MKTRTVEDVQELLKEYKKEQTEIREQIVHILWHMRGGISREEAWALSPIERNDILAFINERWKLVEKSRMALI